MICRYHYFRKHPYVAIVDLICWGFSQGFLGFPTTGSQLLTHQAQQARQMHGTPLHTWRHVPGCILRCVCVCLYIYVFMYIYIYDIYVFKYISNIINIINIDQYHVYIQYNWCIMYYVYNCLCIKCRLQIEVIQSWLVHEIKEHPCKEICGKRSIHIF